jgi:enoyl-CoA hydratase
VRLETDGHVAVLTLDRPAKLNALTSEMTAQLRRGVDTVNEDAGIRAVVVTGTGRAFCAGSDIAGLDDYATPWQFGSRRDYGDIMRELRKPVIAAVNGYAFGGGLELALACDIRLAADTASFAAPEVKLGWIGGSGQSARALAATIAARPPIAAQTAKLNLRAAYQMPLGDAIGYERRLQTICFATRDAAEGRTAFTERRPPEFVGR